MAKINGNDFVIKAAATESGTKQLFLHSQSASLSFSNSLIDVTTKDSNSWSEMISGQKSFSLSADGLIDYADTTDSHDIVELTDFAIAGTKLYFTIGLEAGGANNTYEGEAFIDSIEHSGGVDDVATYSVSLTGTGALAKSS